MLHMEQKDYKLEIIGELLKGESHIRSLAKKLHTNHMAVLRKIRELYKENAVDFRKEGRNNVYFLKKSLEAKSYAFKLENYKLIKILRKYSGLRGIFEKIQKGKVIGLAVLFGSYAKGTAKQESDIDIYIETQSRKLKKEFSLLDTRLNLKIGKYDEKSLLIKEIEKNHVIIKGIEKYYEKNKFFS